MLERAVSYVAQFSLPNSLLFFVYMFFECFEHLSSIRRMTKQECAHYANTPVLLNWKFPCQMRDDDDERASKYQQTLNIPSKIYGLSLHTFHRFAVTTCAGRGARNGNSTNKKLLGLFCVIHSHWESECKTTRYTLDSFWRWYRDWVYKSHSQSLRGDSTVIAIDKQKRWRFHVSSFSSFASILPRARDSKKCSTIFTLRLLQP